VALVLHPKEIVAEITMWVRKSLVVVVVQMLLAATALGAFPETAVLVLLHQ
jgi:hypothetical protein